MVSFSLCSFEESFEECSRFRVKLREARFAPYTGLSRGTAFFRELPLAVDAPHP
jgi:hypothetical protein